MSQVHAIIVDDNADNAAVLAEMLHAEGAQQTTILDPLTLDAVIEQIEQIDMIFLDLEMPNLDGYQLFTKLRQDRRLDGVPIVAYSVHTSEIAQVRQLGFDGFIGKPVNGDQFSAYLRDLQAGKSVWAR